MNHLEVYEMEREWDRGQAQWERWLDRCYGANATSLLLANAAVGIHLNQSRRLT